MDTINLINYLMTNTNDLSILSNILDNVQISQLTLLKAYDVCKNTGDVDSFKLILERVADPSIKKSTIIQASADLNDIFIELIVDSGITADDFQFAQELNSWHNHLVKINYIMDNLADINENPENYMEVLTQYPSEIYYRLLNSNTDVIFSEDLLHDIMDDYWRNNGGEILREINQSLLELDHTRLLDISFKINYRSLFQENHRILEDVITVDLEPVHLELFLTVFKHLSNRTLNYLFRDKLYGNEPEFVEVLLKFNTDWRILKLILKGQIKNKESIILILKNLRVDIVTIAEDIVSSAPNERSAEIFNKNFKKIKSLLRRHTSEIYANEFPIMLEHYPYQSKSGYLDRIINPLDITFEHRKYFVLDNTTDKLFYLNAMEAQPTDFHLYLNESNLMSGRNNFNTVGDTEFFNEGLIFDTMNIILKKDKCLTKVHLLNLIARLTNELGYNGKLLQEVNHEVEQALNAMPENESFCARNIFGDHILTGFDSADYELLINEVAANPPFPTREEELRIVRFRKKYPYYIASRLRKYKLYSFALLLATIKNIRDFGVENIDKKGKSFITLESAVRNDNVFIVNELLNSGVNPLGLNRDNLPLRIAAWRGNMELIQTLVNESARRGIYMPDRMISRIAHPSVRHYFGSAEFSLDEIGEIPEEFSGPHPRAQIFNTGNMMRGMRDTRGQRNRMGTGVARLRNQMQQSQSQQDQEAEEIGEIGSPFAGAGDSPVMDDDTNIDQRRVKRFRRGDN